jgi:hypothetical protein
LGDLCFVAPLGGFDLSLRGAFRRIGDRFVAALKKALAQYGDAMRFIGNGVDAALELSIFGSFTRVGSALRRKLDH